MAVAKPPDCAEASQIASPRSVLLTASRLPQAAMAFPLPHPVVAGIVIGMRSAEEVGQNLDAAVHDRTGTRTRIAWSPGPPGVSRISERRWRLRISQ